MKKYTTAIFCIILMCVSMMACSDHAPSGILEKKVYVKPHTVYVYSPSTHRTRPLCYPPCHIFYVRCDSCGKLHSSIVKKAVFDRYHEGDHIDAKGYCNGEEDNEEGEENLVSGDVLP